MHVATEDLAKIRLWIHLATLSKACWVYCRFYGKDISSHDDILEINMSKTEILAQYLACGLSISPTNTSSPWKEKHNKKYKALWSWGRCPVSVDTHSRHCFPFICNVVDAFQNERFPSHVLYPRLLLTYRKSDFHLHWLPLRPQVQSVMTLLCGPVAAWVRTSLRNHDHQFSQECTSGGPADFLYILHV